MLIRLFDANATLTWKVETSDWDNGRTLLVKSITGKQLVVVGNFTHTATDIVFLPLLVTGPITLQEKVKP